ncbi:MAG TPA: putative metal-binding motif-containing protein, partial [Myxococcota bacterium]|nr:putative metal-binding motif-containing protein [Myxococcota bacterium]
MLALILALLACAPLPASPDAPRRELPCNGLDDDGDGVVDPDDLDGDGVGTCDVDRFDCDDLDPTIAPGRPELCNGLDDDCDGALPAREADDDRDGVPDCALDCDDADPVRQPLDVDGDGWTGCAGDCDDADPTVHPGAPEGCDGVDSDCDGLRGVNEQDVDGDGWSWCEGDCAPTDPWRAPADLDGDRFGGCDAVPDCDDADPRVGPAAEELCNGVDDDCDGRVDEEPEDPGVWYLDGDGDGFGADPLLACDPPPGASAEGGDCDDVDPSRHPFAPERCDGVDQDCDHIVDEQVPHATGWRDRDGDGFGDHAAPIVACQLPPDAATLDGDCDDEAPLTHPGARDLC